MIDTPNSGNEARVDRLRERLRVLFRANLTLIAAAFILPLIYLLVSASVDFEVGRWSLRVYTSPVPGIISVYRSTDDGFAKLAVPEIVSTSDGGFCTIFDSPPLEKADLRILVPTPASTSQNIHVVAQFVSRDGRTCIDLPPALVPTYPANKLEHVSMDDSSFVRTLPRLSAAPVTLPSSFYRARFLYWLLWWNCVLVGVIYSISVTRGSGPTWVTRLGASPIVHRWKTIGSRHLLLFMVLVNAAIFIGTALFFTQRYPVADDPMMAMIANGTLGSHPSEYLVFINVIIGFVLKALSIWNPSIPWYAALMAGALVGSSAIIGFSMVKLWGWRLGGAMYGLSFAFFIFELFYQLQFTTTATLLCLAGLSLALSASQRLRSLSFSLFLALLLVWLGSLVRYHAALLVIILAAPVLCISAIQTRRLSLFVFLVLAVIGTVALRDLDQAYYDASPDWKFFHEYNAARGGLHQTSKFQEFKDNSAVYEKIGWNENDLRMISQNWLYQDLNVFSFKNLVYLNEHLAPPQDPSKGLFAFLRPFYMYLWMPFLVIVCLLSYSLAGELTLTCTLGIAVPLFAIIYHLARTSHIPDHVYIPAMLEAFLLTIFLANHRRRTRENRLGIACFVSLGLFLLCFEFFSIQESSDRDQRRTVELNKALDKINFLKDKALQVSITSIRYEDLPPFGNDNRLRNLNFIDGLWSYPSPDTLSAYRRNGLNSPLRDLVEKDNFLLLIPTFSWDRARDVQTFLREHYQLNSTYEVVTDPNREMCCYPNFTVLKFHLSATPHSPTATRDSHSQ